MSTNVENFRELLKKHFSQRTIERISLRTCDQSNSPLWFLYRRCVITGTLAKRIISQSLKNENNPKINRSISKIFKNTFTSEAMLYGTENEKNALETFLKIYKTTHTDVTVRPTGVVLYKHAPFIAGSPDAIISCSCCEEPILTEFKCPFRLKDTGISNWSILEYLDKHQKLKKNHTYMNQLNIYQGILEIKNAFFVVYAKGEVIIQEIHFDKHFFDFQVKHITSYYERFYLPTVINTKI